MQPPPAVTRTPQTGANPPVPTAAVVHTATSLVQPAPVQELNTTPSTGNVESQLKSILTNFKDEIKSELKNSIKNKKNKISDKGSVNSSDSSSESDSDESQDSNVPLADWRGGDKKQKLGPKYKGLEPLVPHDTRFATVVNYRRYRLKNRDQSQGRRVSSKTARNSRKILKNLPCEKFEGDPPLNIINFLSEVKQQFNNNNISEGSAFLILKDLLAGDCRDEYVEHIQMGETELESISSWPEAVQFLLTRYCKNVYLTTALDEWDSLKQLPVESIESYYKRLRKAASACGSIFNTITFITRFIKGLLPGIQPSVMSKHETKPFQTLGDAISAAIHAENTYREATKKAPSTTYASERTRPVFTRNKARSANAISIIQRDDAATPAHHHTVTDSELYDDDAETGTSTRNAYGVPGSSSPSCPPTLQQDTLAAIVPHPAQSRGNPLARSSASQQPGWRDNSKIICHTCFDHGHISPNCPLNRNNFSDTEHNEIIRKNIMKLPPTLLASLIQQGHVPMYRESPTLPTQLVDSSNPIVESTVDINPPPRPDGEVKK